MLLAEIHGHVVPEAVGNEDYLTSTVFGHLRYIPLNLFWEDLFSRAIGLPVEGREQSLLESVTKSVGPLSKYDSISVHFWPAHKIFGTPDLAICFSGAQGPPFVLIVEAKLWAGKSGTGENDQLLRYLRLLADLGNLGSEKGSFERDARSALLYLTVHDSLAELTETSMLCEEGSSMRAQLFRAQWQDIQEAAEHSSRQANGISQTILRDLATFLWLRGLQYFRGFRVELDGLYAARDGGFYQPENTTFRGFSSNLASLLAIDDGEFYQRSREPVIRANVKGT